MIASEETNAATQMTEAAGKVYTVLIGACRTLTLYPEGHALTLNAAQQLHTRIDAYLRTYGTLRLEFEKDRVLSSGEPLSQPPPAEGSPAFSLFRDGIRWLEFTEGLAPDELCNILGILNRYSALAAEPEGDIAIAFWESQFPHLHYEVVDFAATTPSAPSASSPSGVAGSGTVTTGEAGRKQGCAGSPSTGSDTPESAPSTETEGAETTHTKSRLSGDMEFTNKEQTRADLFQTPGKKSRGEGNLPTEPLQPSVPPLPPEAIDFTPHDLERLRERARLEEQPKPTAYLDALLDSLLQHQEKESADIILKVLTEEFTNAMTRQDLTAMLKILKGLEEIADRSDPRTPWVGPGLQHFFRTVSTPESLAPLKEIWCGINPSQLDTFRQVIERLHPIAAGSVAPLLICAFTPEIQRLLENVLMSFAMRDPQPFRALIQTPDERLMERLIPVIAQLNGEKAFPLLLQIAKHKSPKLRRMAVKAIVEAGPDRIKELFDLFVRDEETPIRQLLLEHLGRSRNEVAEHHLLAYLQSKPFHGAAEELVLACYKTLGRCGSTHSIPFLRKTLVERGWVPGYRRLLHRNGAALALAELATPESNRVLVDAGRSWYPGIRRIVQKACRVGVPKEREN